MERVEERDRRPGFGQKVFAIIAAILLIFYFIVDQRAQDVIVGWTESEQYDKRTFSSENRTVSFTEDAWNVLQRHWEETREREFRLCLRGDIQESRYTVRSVYEPEITHSSVFHISSAPCPSRTVVDLHSHPPGRCVASQQDVAHIEQVRERDPRVLLAVMCGPERISLY